MYVRSIDRCRDCGAALVEASLVFGNARSSKVKVGRFEKPQYLMSCPMCGRLYVVPA